MRKKIVVILLTLCMAVLLSACGDDNKVTGISLKKTSFNLITTDDPVSVDLSLAPDGLDKASITWESSDVTVAKVDGDSTTMSGSAHAMITPIGAGDAEITVSSKNGQTAKCAISVREPIFAESITLGLDNPTELIIGDTKNLEAEVKPANADDATLTYESSAPDIVSVDEDGNITAVKSGSSTIKAVASNGVNAQCKIDVREPIPVQRIELSEKELDIYMKTGAQSLTCTILPKDADDKEITWESSDSNVARVSEGKITAVKEGTATITASSSNGVKATCSVNVKALTPDALDELMKTQPLYVASTEYVVQSNEWKTLYPDMLQAVIYNAGEDSIKNAVVAFVAWDQNNLPVNIFSSGIDIEGNYLPQVNYSNINLVPGNSYGSDSGFEIDESNNIAQFKACVVSYETFDGTTYENPYFKLFEEMYKEKPFAF